MQLQNVIYNFVKLEKADDALKELVNHYANRTLIVSCTKDYTFIKGKGLCTVEDVLKPPGSLLLIVLRR